VKTGQQGSRSIETAQRRDEKRAKQTVEMYAAQTSTRTVRKRPLTKRSIVVEHFSLALLPFPNLNPRLRSCRASWTSRLAAFPS
jgi:hypothetical protein